MWWNHSLGRPFAPETTVFRRYGTAPGAEADKAITTIAFSMQALLVRREAPRWRHILCPSEIEGQIFLGVDTIERQFNELQLIIYALTYIIRTLRSGNVAVAASSSATRLILLSLLITNRNGTVFFSSKF
jgi:hypothetical protein